MRVMDVARWVIAGGLSWALAGCSTPTKLEGVSSDPEAAARGAGYRRPLVCGVGRSPEVRRQVEEAFKKALNDRGVDAVPSSDYVPETQQADEQTLEAVVRNSKADAILLTRLAKVERRADVGAAGPPRAAVPAPGGANGYYGIYAWAWGGVYDPPQVYAVDSVVLETFLIDTRTSAVVWSGATRVMDPTKVQRDAADLAKQVVGDLVKRGLVPGAPR